MTERHKIGAQTQRLSENAFAVLQRLLWRYNQPQFGRRTLRSWRRLNQPLGGLRLPKSVALPKLVSWAMFRTAQTHEVDCMDARIAILTCVLIVGVGVSVSPCH